MKLSYVSCYAELDHKVKLVEFQSFYLLVFKL